MSEITAAVAGATDTDTLASGEDQQVRVSREEEARVDAALGWKVLPPTRVPIAVYERLFEEAGAHGVVLAAYVRGVLRGALGHAPVEDEVPLPGITRMTGTTRVEPTTRPDERTCPAFDGADTPRSDDGEREPRDDAVRPSDVCPITRAEWAKSLNRRAEVEQQLFDMAAGKVPLPTAAECRALATRLGVPDDWRAIARQHTEADVCVSQASAPQPVAPQSAVTLPLEQALSALIDLVAPGLDSGNVLADAREAARRLTHSADQPVAWMVRDAAGGLSLFSDHDEARGYADWANGGGRLVRPLYTRPSSAAAAVQSRCGNEASRADAVRGASNE